jgi:hypothetical protein
MRRMHCYKIIFGFWWTKQVSKFPIKVSLKGSLDVAAQGAHTSLCRSILAEGMKHVSRNLMIVWVAQCGVTAEMGLVGRVN